MCALSGLTATVRWIVRPLFLASALSSCWSAQGPSDRSADPPFLEQTPADVEIVLSRDRYVHGEEIVFKIVNLSDRPVHYRGGCTVPSVFRTVDWGEIPLTIETDDVIPPVARLEPGAQQRCRWDQRAWQDPTREGIARFQHYHRSMQVPPGSYRLGLHYASRESDLDNAERRSFVRSPIFSIE